MRRLLVVLAGVTLLATACPGGDDEAEIERSPTPIPAVTPSPTPTPTPEIRFELAGTVRAALPPTTFDAERLEEAAQPPVETPDTTPETAEETPEVTPEAPQGSGGIVVRVTELTGSVEACGFEDGDNVAVLFGPDLAVEPETLREDEDFPENLQNVGVTVLGRIHEADQAAGQCLFVADTLRRGITEVGETPAPAATATPATGTRTTRTPTPRPRSTPTPTPRATATATAAPATQTPELPPESPDQTPAT